MKPRITIIPALLAILCTSITGCNKLKISETPVSQEVTCAENNFNKVQCTNNYRDADDLKDCEEKYNLGVEKERNRLQMLNDQIIIEIQKNQVADAKLHISQLRWEYSHPCKNTMDAELVDVWTQKRDHLSSLIDENIAETKASEAAIKAEQKEREDRARKAEQDKADKKNFDALDKEIDKSF